MGRLLYPELSSQSRAWVEEQFYRPTEHLTDFGRNLYDRAVNFFKKATDGTIERSVRSMYRSLKGAHSPNTIFDIDTVQELRSAKPLMQRYIMADEEVRGLYQRQLCDGYSDSYVDYHPGDIGKDHYDWRRVMSGAVVDIDEDNEEPTKPWRVVTYVDDLEEGDRLLEVDEKFILRNAWAVARSAIAAGKDPTDIFGGDLAV